MFEIKSTKFAGYNLHEFFQGSLAVGCVVVTRYRRIDFQVTHVDLQKRLLMPALIQLSEEYLAKGKDLYCDKIPV